MAKLSRAYSCAAPSAALPPLAACEIFGPHCWAPVVRLVLGQAPEPRLSDLLLKEWNRMTAKAEANPGGALERRILAANAAAAAGKEEGKP